MKKLMSKKESKVKSTRKDKDILLNIVGVPPTNVNVNKRLAGIKNEEHHLYKISIDTTKRNENKSAVNSSLLTHQVNKAMGNANEKAKPNTSKASSKWGKSKSKENKKTDVCLTVLDEGPGGIKIVNTSSKAQKDIPPEDEAFSPKSSVQSPEARDYNTYVGNKEANNSSLERNQLQVSETEDNQDHNYNLEKPIRINLLPNWQGFEVDNVNNKAPVRKDLQPDKIMQHPKMLEIEDKELNSVYNKKPLTEHPNFVRRLPTKEDKYYPAKGQYIPTTVSRGDNKNIILEQFPRNVSGIEKNETLSHNDPLSRQLFSENNPLFPTSAETMTQSPVRSTTDMTKERKPSKQIKQLRTELHTENTNEDQNKLNKSIKPKTEDKQIMTDNILTKSSKTPNPVSDKINTVSKLSVPHNKQSSESGKHSKLIYDENRNKNKLIKSSLVSTIPKPSFRMSRAPVLRDSSDHSPKSKLPSVHKKGSSKPSVDLNIDDMPNVRTNSLEASQYIQKPAIKEITVREDKQNNGQYSIPIIHKGEKYIVDESTLKKENGQMVNIANTKPLQEHDTISLEILQHNYDKPSLLRNEHSQKEPTFATVISSNRLESMKSNIVGQELLPHERKEMVARNPNHSERAMGNNHSIKTKPVNERIYATKRVINENSPSYYDRLGDSLDNLKFKNQYGTTNTQIDKYEFPSDAAKKSFHAQSPTFMNGFDSSKMKPEEEPMNAPKPVMNGEATTNDLSDRSLDKGRPTDASEVSKTSSGKYSFSFDGFEDIPSKRKSHDNFVDVGKELPIIYKKGNVDKGNSTGIPTDSVHQSWMSSFKDVKTKPIDEIVHASKQVMDNTASPSHSSFMKKIKPEGNLMESYAEFGKEMPQIYRETNVNQGISTTQSWMSNVHDIKTKPIDKGVHSSKQAKDNISPNFDNSLKNVIGEEKPMNSYTDFGKEVPQIYKKASIDPKLSIGTPNDSVHQSWMDSVKEITTKPLEKTVDSSKQIMDSLTPSYDSYLNKVKVDGKSMASYTDFGKDLPQVSKITNFDKGISANIPTDSVHQSLKRSEKDIKAKPLDKTMDTSKQLIHITSPSYDSYLKKVEADRKQDVSKTESDVKGYSFGVPPKKTIHENPILFEKALDKGKSKEKQENDLIPVGQYVVPSKLVDNDHDTSPPLEYGHTGIMAYPGQVKENHPFLYDSKGRPQIIEKVEQSDLPISQLEKGASNKPAHEDESFNKGKTPPVKTQLNDNEIADKTLSKMYKLFDDVEQLPARSESEHEAINTNVIVYPGQVKKKDPFLYDSNGSLQKIEMDKQSNLPITQLENKVPSDKYVPTHKGKDFDKDQTSSDNIQPIDVDMAGITLSKIYQLIDDVGKLHFKSESEPENIDTELVHSEEKKRTGTPVVGKQHGEKRKKSVVAEPRSHKLKREDPFSQRTHDQMVFLGKIPNTTYNVFFSPETAKGKKKDTEKMDQIQASKEPLKHKKHGKHKFKDSHKVHKVKDSPKGLIIFVNKKTAEAGHNPFRCAGEQRLVMSAAVPGQQNLPNNKTNQKHIGSKSTKYPQELQEKSKEEHDYLHYLQSDLHNYNVQTPKLRMSTDDNNKNTSVEKSPNGTKITEKYPCGCWRIISSDRDHEITGEEIINAFCTMGDKCSVSLPELQKTLRVIPYQSSNTEYSGSSHYGDDDNYDIFKKIEVFANGIFSRKPIKDKPPPPTMRGTNYTGTVNIKSNKMNATCNLYLDQNLKNYLLDNWDDFRGMLKNS